MVIGNLLYGPPDLNNMGGQFMSNYQTALASDIQVITSLPTTAVGMTAPLALTPRPDLSGLRVKSPNDPAIYLIDPDGYRRWIPNPATYNNLFRDWNGVVISIDINEIALGLNLTDGAVLARATGTAPVYLVSNGIKRWITSPSAMDKYYFNWNTIIQIPHVLIDSIPTGANWS
jgi:hypothetical protein